jgi:hypothetical protein
VIGQAFVEQQEQKSYDANMNGQPNICKPIESISSFVQETCWTLDHQQLSTSDALFSDHQCL